MVDRRAPTTQCILSLSLKIVPGVRLGSYEIVSSVGAGGMGEVYRARDSQLAREVAIKVLPEFFASDADWLRRFEQEARAAAALNHPNILAVYQLGTYEGTPYLVSELLEGETLRDRLCRGPLSLRKTINYGVQIAHGLAAAHDKGIVHRDLKPENLFITKDGRAKILDFGLAKVTQPAEAEPDSADALTLHTTPGIVLGTSGYMSPEQVRGQAIDHRSDIFAFGAILREMVTGRRTFHKQTSADTMSAILNEEPRPISEVVPSMPLGLQRVVHRCLEKNPEQRFQSASDLGFALEALSDSGATAATSTRLETIDSRFRRGAAIGAAALAVVAAAVALGYMWARPASVPRGSNYVQLTHDGQPKSLLGTDGSRLYLGLGTFPFQGGAELPISGGEPRIIAMPSARAVPVVLSPDGSDLLVVDGQGVPPSGSLWRMPVTGGSPRRLSDVTGETGAWSPDGKLLAYTKLNELFLAEADGTGSRKLCSVKGDINSVVWSPDGQQLRIDASETVGQHELWEVTANGKNLHRLLAGWHNPPDECCGRWTADGKYFLFQSTGQIWALAKPGFLRSEPKPIQLTSSPMSLSTPIPGKDGNKLYVVGQVYHGELMRYDVKSSQFAPVLGGISAEYADYSRNGEWIAYVSYPEGTLWRSRVDGSERLQLTYPPMYPMLPRWSPDGKRIIFFEFERNSKPARIYEISPEGGDPGELLPDDPSQQVDPNWSPDGIKVVFAGTSTDAGSVIRVLDLATRKVSTLTGSEGLFSPRWSPDGRYIGAFSRDSARLLLFDLQGEKWSELAQGSFGWLNWSKDGHYVYVLDQGGKGAVLRVRISDHKTEHVVDFNNFKTTGRYRGALALAPDDSPLLLRETGTQDVYSLDWETP